MKRWPLVALDADGVLLGYLERYADAWCDAFGARPGIRDPLGYGPLDSWDVFRLDTDGRVRLCKHFDANFWSSVPVLLRAVDACTRLHDAGFELAFVSTLDTESEASRLKNLCAFGYLIERVYATPHDGAHRSPKADRLADLRPLAFVDDYLPYLSGVPSEVHTALVTRGAKGDPNAAPEMVLEKSTHQDLAAFADFWFQRPAT